MTTPSDFPWLEGPTSRRFAGRVALVTGAGGAGIGSATAKRLASEGATIVAVEHHDGRAKAIVESLEKAYDVPVRGYTLDVTDRVAVDEMLASADDEDVAVVAVEEEATP